MKRIGFNYLCFAIAILIIAGCMGNRASQTTAVDEPSTADVVLDDDVEDFFGSLDHLNEVEIEIAMQMDSLSARPWNKKEYERLKLAIDNYIDGFNAKYSFHSMLNGKYSLSMDKEANAIMATADCSRKHNHSRLDEIMKERGRFDLEITSMGKSVRNKYKTHEELKRFILTFNTKQKVSSCTEKYDEKFEEDTRREAKKKYDTYKPVCAYLAQNLQKPNFDKRRLDYCNQIIALLDSENINIKKLRIARASILKTYGNSHPDQMEKWDKLINDIISRLESESEVQ